MSKISDLVKDPEWQRIRQSLVGKWKTNPDWCCLQLKHYLGDLRRAPENKLRIVANYLVGSGFRTGQIDAQCSKILRHQIFIEIRRRKQID